MYLGIEHEKPSTNAAVNATAGQIVLYEGAVAKTYFFSTSGGRTASAEDVFGEPVPYLVSVADPYDSISPHHDWGPLVFTGAKLAKVLKMKGRVVDLQPEVNSSGRIKVLNVVGTEGHACDAGRGHTAPARTAVDLVQRRRSVADCAAATGRLWGTRQADGRRARSDRNGAAAIARRQLDGGW